MSHETAPDSPVELTEPEDVRHRLEALKRSHTTNLHLDGAGDAAWPVNVVAVKPGTGLEIDIGRADEIVPLLEAGTTFWLIGETDDTMMETPALRLAEEQPSRRHWIACDYPESIHTSPRRTGFRAAVTRNMDIRVELTAPCCPMTVTGRIDNISMGGCLLVLPLADSAVLYGEKRMAELSMRFPNGEQLETRGHIRHVRPDKEWQQGRVGYQFAESSAEFGRKVAYYVREIDRHRAYEQTHDEFAYTPSVLFDAPVQPGRKKRRRGVKNDLVTQELMAIAGQLDAQLIQIKAGGPVATESLLQHGKKLLDLLRRNREALLFAASRMLAQPTPVSHGIGVAVRLADLLEWQNSHDQPLDAVIACALVHDFGKVLLPDAVRHATVPYGADQRATLSTHVPLLIERLHEPENLPAEVITAVIGQANERLDGSGYPQTLSGDDLPDLARAMAVVDVADAMRRDRPDRKALPLMAVYKHMLQAKSQLDNGWVQRYIRRFGVTPIGALARYGNGTLAWIQRLDPNGQPAQVRIAALAGDEEQPVGASVDGKDLAALGELDKLVEPREHGLT